MRRAPLWLTLASAALAGAWFTWLLVRRTVRLGAETPAAKLRLTWSLPLPRSRLICSDVVRAPVNA